MFSKFFPSFEGFIKIGRDFADRDFLVRMGLAGPEPDLFIPRYTIAPTQTAWIIVENEDGKRELHQSKWGLIPFWAKDAKIGNSLINARSETVATKPAFRTSFGCFRQGRVVSCYLGSEDLLRALYLHALAARKRKLSAAACLDLLPFVNPSPRARHRF